MNIDLRHRSGIDSPSWKGGKPNCIDCGKKVTKYTAIRCRNCNLKFHSEENSYRWKGENVSYRNLHRWVERHLGKAFKCMKNITHRSTRYHWANISKKYKRDLSDWMQLCPSCNLKDRIGRRVSP